MPDETLIDLNQVTPEWLTAVLRRDGALMSGAVASFETEDAVRELSSNACLRLTYTPDANGDCPTRLLLKIVHTMTALDDLGVSF